MLDGIMNEPRLHSFFMGGFECSTHRNARGKRLDLIAVTRHDEFAEADYARLMRENIRTARDGARWHLIEQEPFRYDFSSLKSSDRGRKKHGDPSDLGLFPLRISGRPGYLLARLY